jgi:hypothetical protein
MTILNLSSTISTPRILVTDEVFQISGETRPENPKQFYDEVFAALSKVADHLKHDNNVAYRFEFDFEYISTSSLIMIKKLLMEIKTLQDTHSNMGACWLYYHMDEDMRLLGEEMVLITEVKMDVAKREI